MSKTHRIIVDGIGGIGVGAVRECVRLPWIEIVGARVYSDHKTSGTSASWPGWTRSG